MYTPKYRQVYISLFLLFYTYLLFFKCSFLCYMKKIFCVMIKELNSESCSCNPHMTRTELFCVCVLRWYGTPCNIFKDDRVLKYDYNQGFKNFKNL